jgi:hypothetical protein
VRLAVRPDVVVVPGVELEGVELKRVKTPLPNN